jgi:sigma-B regulation protein RsbU (phosphoserine phosphatase)
MTLRILIIDDDPITRMVLKKTLLGQGYAVTEAQTGEEGMIQAKQLHPALIICDWQMSGMDGLAVCHQIKSDPALSTTFFILLTARTAVADRVEGLNTGADEFLSKPIEVSELQARVKAGLRIYQSAKDLQKLAQDLHAQKQALETELTEAAEYVRSLLPLSIDGTVAIASRFLPSKQLGGDCFDYYWIDSDFLVMYLLDVSGHGLKAALPSVVIQNTLRSQSLPRVNFYRPDHVLKALNETFQMEKQNECYFTIWYGVYNQPKRQLTYASAGHPPAILMTNGASDRLVSTPEVKQLKTCGFPIGMLPDATYTSQSCKVEQNSTLYIFSDGIYEIKQPDGDFWSLDGFIELLMKYSVTVGSEGLDQILQHVQTIGGSSIFEDDCSLLQVRLS